MTQATIGSLRVDLGLRTAAFEKGINNVERHLKSVERSLKRSAQKFQQAGKAMSIGLTAPLAAIGISSAKVAMDVEEMESAFAVAFGGATDSVRSWAVETGNAMGRATQTIQGDALKFQTLLANTLDPEQSVEFSKKLAVLTQDMQSFYNLGDGEATQKLFSGLTGESEPLKALGILINETSVGARALEMGFVKVNGRFTESEKVQARLSLIMEKTALAQGDVERTSGSASNQIRAAKEAFAELQVIIGTKVIPAIKPLIEGLTRMIERFNTLSPGMQKTVVIAAALAAAAGPLTVAISAFIVPIGKLIALNKILAGAGGFAGLKASILGLMGPVGWMLTALVAAGGLLFALNKWQNSLSDVESAHTELYALIDKSKSIRDQEIEDTKAAMDMRFQQLQIIRDEIAERLRLKKAILDQKLAEAEARASRPKRAGGRLGNVGGDVQDTALAAEIQGLREAVALAQREMAANDQAQMDAAMRGASGPTAPSVTTIPATTTDADTDAQDRYTAAQKRALEAYQEAQAQRDDAEQDMLADLAAQQTATADANRSVVDQIVAHHELAAAYRVSFEEGRLVAEMQAIQASGVEYTTDKLREMAQASLDASDAATSAMTNARDSAVETGDAMSDAFTKGANAFTGLINAIKSGDIGSILQQGLGFLSQLKGNGSGGSGGGFAGLFDKGGRISTGQWGIAGENGPEIIRGPASVTSTAQTARMMRGATSGGASVRPIRIQVEANDYFDAKVAGTSAAITDARAPGHAQRTMGEAMRTQTKQNKRRLA